MRFFSAQTLTLHIQRFQPVAGASYKPLPQYIQAKKACVNPQNKDLKCALWCILAHVHPAAKDPQRVSKYRPYEDEIKVLTHQ